MRLRPMGVMLGCALLGLMPRLWAQTRNSEPIGTILDLHGTWRVADQAKAVQAGQAVPAGALLKPESPRVNDFVVVLLLNGKRLAIRCEDSPANPCSSGLRLPATYLDNDSAAHRMVEAVMQVFLNRQPEVARSFSQTMARGAGGTANAEMVVPVESGKPLRLDRVFALLSSADYVLELRKLSDNSLLSSKTVAWNQFEDQAVTLPASGAYLILFVRQNAEVAMSLFVLGVSADSYAEATKSFDKARELCADWEGPDGRASAHEFLRAYLISLASKQ